MSTDKTTELKEIYTPLFENIVVEFTIPDKRPGGVMLNDKQLRELYDDQTSVLKVVAIADKVTAVKIGDYVLPSPRCNLIQVPLLNKTKTGIQHGQLHISEILGIVDADFAIVQTTTTKEAIN